MEVKLSVVIPVYCLKKYVLECVSSILEQQTDFEFEVLVGDDASTDGTPELLQKYYKGLSVERAKRLKLFLSSENSGLPGNLKSLFAQCQGQYIAYLDGDDVALPGKLQQQVDYLDAHPNCAIVYHEAEMFDSETGKHLGLYTRDFYNAKYIPPQAGIDHLVKYGTFLQASAVMFRHHAHLDQVLDPRCRIIVDFPMHMFNAFYGKGTIDRLDLTLGRYRLHPDSFGGQTSRSADRREQVLSELLIACENAEQMGVSNSDTAKGKSHFCYAAALFFLRMGELALFIKYIEKSAGQRLFFDQKHRFIYENRSSSDTILDKYPF